MKNNFRITGIVLFISILIIFSCTKTEKEEIDEVTMTPAVNPSSPEEILDYIRSLGFSDSNIVEAEKKFIVEGDIVFSKDMVVPHSNLSGRGNQNYGLQLVNLAHHTNIRIRIDPSLAVLTAVINAAISQWNTAGSNIHFNVVTSGSFDILIQNHDYGTGSGVCADARFPLNGLAGNNIDVNRNYVTTFSFAQQTMAILHELGHSIGLMHTNSNANWIQGGYTYVPTAVPGAAGPDINSVMNLDICNSSPTQLSLKDKSALYSLYPTLFPKNTQIQILPYPGSPFTITWSTQSPIRSDPNITLIGYDIHYSGFSGINFGGIASISGPTTFNVPNVSPHPTSGPTTTGGIQAMVVAKYSNGSSHPGPTVTRNKVGGVWQ